MAYPSALTADEDLVPVYIAAASMLPDTIASLHEAAAAAIRRDLMTTGSTAEQLEALTEASLEALKVPACHYVMYLLNRPSTRADSALLELAQSYLKEYQRVLRSTVIESTASDAPAAGPAANNRVWLG